MDIQLIRHCALGIANALNFLHSNNVVHRFLRDTSVFITMTGKAFSSAQYKILLTFYNAVLGEVKVGDYGVERKLSELLRSVNKTNAIVDPFAPSIGRGAKKGDIYRFGILVLSLFKGGRISQNPPDIPSSLPSEVQHFIRKYYSISVKIFTVKFLTIFFMF